MSKPTDTQICEANITGYCETHKQEWNKCHPTDTNQASEDHVHYGGICKKEFNRGYAFGRKDSYDELLKTPEAEASTIFEDNSVIIKIPRKEYERLQIEVEKNK